MKTNITTLDRVDHSSGNRLVKLALVLAAATLAASNRALASDWYCDASNGSDANDGMTPATAWKTLTHAVGAVPGPTAGHVFHLAAGLYDPANGEVYPLQVRNHMQIVGAGRDLTILAGSPSSLLIYRSSLGGGPSDPIDPDTLLRGLTLRDSVVGLEIESDWNAVKPSFENLRLTALSAAAVTLVATSSFGNHYASASFLSVAIDGCGAGFDVQTSASSTAGFASAVLAATDVQVSGCGADAISLFSLALNAASTQSEARAVLARCQLTGNAGNGVSMHGGAAKLLRADSSLIAANQSSGVDAVAGTPVAGASLVELRGSTVAANLAYGLRVLPNQPALIAGAIFFGNGEDLDLHGPVSANVSCSGDGDLLGQPGCIAADPLFVNPALSDFRLRFGSPCAESGDPATNGTLDLLGHVRPFDGDLDTQAAPDMGAFELEPLHRIGTPSLGQQFGFEFWGQSGASSTLYLAKSPLTPPQSTPFGDFYLDPSNLILLGTLPAQPGPPFVLRRTMPNNPVLIGTKFSFQALTDSSLAPQGQAYTNPTSFVVAP